MKENFENYGIKHLGISSTNIFTAKKIQTAAFQNVSRNSVGTPMILEEREMQMTQMSVFDRLMAERIIWVSGPVESGMAAIIQAQLMFLDSKEEKDITIHLDTPGGNVCAGLSIRDVMNYVKSDIATINLGMCASMGSILLSSGAKGKRSSLLFSTVMTHHVSSGTQGVIDDQRISLNESEKYNYLLFKILAENTGKSFEEIHDLSNRNKWFNSDEALEYNLIDEIIQGSEKNNISKLMDGFNDYYDKYVRHK